MITTRSRFWSWFRKLLLLPLLPLLPMLPLLPLLPLLPPAEIVSFRNVDHIFMQKMNLGWRGSRMCCFDI